MKDTTTRGTNILNKYKSINYDSDVTLKTKPYESFEQLGVTFNSKIPAVHKRRGNTMLKLIV